MRMFHSLLGASSEFPASLKPLFSVLWMGQISGSTLVDQSGNGNDITVTNKDFSTTIPNTSNATLSLANDVSLKTDDDFDCVWFDDAGSVRAVTSNELSINDYSRTLVKYSDSSPYDVEWIGLLDDAATPTSDQWNQLHEYFTLPIYWSGVFNASGEYKNNRGLFGVGYKAWITQCEDDLAFTGLSTTVKSSINKYCIGHINEGTWDKQDRNYQWALNDAGDGTLLTTYGTVSLKTPNSTRGSFPNGANYENDGWYGTIASSQYFETNFNPITEGVNYLQNSASRSMYRYRAKVASTSYMDGMKTDAKNILTNAGSSTLQRINSNSITSGVTFASTGYTGLNRSAASGAGSVEIYNGLTKTSYDVTSAAPASQSFVAARSNFGYGDDGHSMYNVGGSLTESEHNYMRSAQISHLARI